MLPLAVQSVRNTGNYSLRKNPPNIKKYINLPKAAFEVILVKEFPFNNNGKIKIQLFFFTTYGWSKFKKKYKKDPCIL